MPKQHGDTLVPVIGIAQLSSSVIKAVQFVEMGAVRQIHHRHVNTSHKMEELITLTSEIPLVFLKI